jgi:hypothetical protein
MIRFPGDKRFDHLVAAGMTVDEEDEGQDSEDDTKDEEQSDTAVDEGKEDHDQRVDDVQEDDDPQDEDEELEDDPQDVDEELESDHQDVDQGEGNGDQADKGEEDKQHTEDEEQADLPILDLRRSARQRDQSSHPAHYRQIVAGPRKQPGRGTSKPQHHSRATLLQLVSIWLASLI